MPIQMQGKLGCDKKERLRNHLQLELFRLRMILGYKSEQRMRLKKEIHLLSIYLLWRCASFLLWFKLGALPFKILFIIITMILIYKVINFQTTVSSPLSLIHYLRVSKLENHIHLHLCLYMPVHAIAHDHVILTLQKKIALYSL